MEVRPIYITIFRCAHVQKRIQCYDLPYQTNIGDALAQATESKIRQAGYAMRFRDIGWTRPVTEWIPRDVMNISGTAISVMVRPLHEGSEREECIYHILRTLKHIA
uniref:Prophage protein n=1 Tax=Haemonchus contortus TaxID=6289 RepID=A0A7I4Y8C3_HAECO